MGAARRALPMGALALLVAGVAGGLVATGLFGVASGEGPAGSTSARTVSVEGVGTVPIGSTDSVGQATAVYREGMAKALADGQAKAAFLAEKAGVALGAVTSIVEDGGSIECAGANGQEYAGYEGEWPDFGYGRSPNVAATSAPAAATGTSAPTVSHRPKTRHRHPRAKKATASRCNLTANLSEVYALG